MSAKSKRRRKKPCRHPNAYVQRYGLTGLLGNVICPDCGFTRFWDAY